MGRPLNLLVGTLATALVTVGVAAQTGTIHFPNERASGGVQAEHAAGSPTPEAGPSPPAAPSATPAAEVPPPPPANSPPKHNKKHDG
ncbi:MAG: hypothetical protein E6I81_10520 [Chloroflexi bacterium]|nr:MAG: hypothetical protein E6I89_12100 [Chloroflexota bacterium]TMD71428.1 MAG: hypothetical protein E6I81_10520 [Chloroflexota bacterium]